MLGDGVGLCLALLNEVKGSVTIDFFRHFTTVCKEHRHDCVNHCQIQPFSAQMLGTGLARYSEMAVGLPIGCCRHIQQARHLLGGLTCKHGLQ